MRYLLFVMLFFVLVGCQREDSLFHEVPTPEINSEQVRQAVEVHTLHPSVVNSDWWQKMPGANQDILRLELSGDRSAITFPELSRRFAAVRSSAAFQAKANVCSSYPAGAPNGDVTLNSQADVDAFGAQNCKVITGALVVVDTLGPDPICDLRPLRKIREIGSSMNVRSDCLTSLDGLDKIKSIGELGPFGFVAVGGANLTDINALEKVKVVTGSINVLGTESLTSTGSAFSRIATIESGKSSNLLTSVFVLNLNVNTALTDISGFSNLTYIEGGPRISANDALLNLDGLSGLNAVDSDIFIVNNASLQNVDEFSNLTSIAGNLFVLDNPQLSSCCGLYGLLTGGVGGVVGIFNNGAGCTDLDIIAGGPCP